MHCIRQVETSQPISTPCSLLFIAMIVSSFLRFTDLACSCCGCVSASGGEGKRCAPASQASGHDSSFPAELKVTVPTCFTEIAWLAGQIFRTKSGFHVWRLEESMRSKSEHSELKNAEHCGTEFAASTGAGGGMLSWHQASCQDST